MLSSVFANLPGRRDRRAAGLRAVIEKKLPDAQVRPSEVRSLPEMRERANTPAGRARAQGREAESVQLQAQPEVADGREAVEALLQQIEHDAQDQGLPWDGQLLTDLRNGLGLPR
ncbi:putative uncharacterized protein [Burkholderiales bacterium GJ-E10]|nr:putative uncharacterized protein [Burkholderiales bacterium GJ-E10]